MRTVGIGLAAMLAGAGCSVLINPGDNGPGDVAPNDASSSADAIDSPDGGGPAFGSVTQVELGITDSHDDPTLTEDELEIYFNRGKDIYYSTRATAADPWGPPLLATLLSSGFEENSPELSPSGLEIWFARSSATGYEIWTSSRLSRTDPWAIPWLEDTLNTSYHESGASPSHDRLQMIVTSARGMGEASLDMYLYERASVGGPWTLRGALPAEINGQSEDGNGALPGQSRELYYDTDAGGNFDIYLATRTTNQDPFGSPVAVQGLATSDDEAQPWVSTDGKRIYFTRRIGGVSRIYRASR